MTWQKLRDICELKYGSSLPAAARNGDAFPVYGSNGIVGTHSEPFSHGPTIIVGRKGSIGEINFSKVSCWPIDTTYFIDSTATKADLRWLAYALSGLRLGELNKATGVPGLNRNDAYEKLIFVPPLAEQKRIAAILDQADDLRRKRQRALDRLNQLGQAIFYEMFGHPTTNPKTWPIAKASELADRITVGLVVRPASYYRDSGVPAIRGTNIKESGIDLSDVVYFSEQDNVTKLAKSRIWSNDIVIVRSGRPGLAAIVPPELHGANAIDVLIFTPMTEKVTPQFIRDLINSEGGKRLVLSESRGQVQQHFNVGSLSEAEFFVPPFNLQLDYQRRIQELQDQATRFKNAARASDGLFYSLQHRAFRGEL